MKGSLVDEHTVRALSKAGKEVSFLLFIQGHIQSFSQPGKVLRIIIILQNRLKVLFFELVDDTFYSICFDLASALHSLHIFRFHCFNYLKMSPKIGKFSAADVGSVSELPALFLLHLHHRINRKHLRDLSLFFIGHFLVF